ncbi:MAG: carotenoid biosynthesis protein [Patescibacteria group bacterium]|nr:carotenoid biosynthesis protein [Patescibacteria group bacterium]MDD5490646.1 carotenoid biosynthesis protein [Patescibacteria group bacterium]
MNIIITLIELGTYILTAIIFIHAWKKKPYYAFVILAAIIFGFLAEYSAVSKIPQPYYYPHALIALPGPVPLNICLGWGIIIYAAMLTAIKLKVKWWLRPLAAGFLAVIIDFAEDPPYVKMDLWQWTPPHPEAWFGIPWSNYVGWFLIVVIFLFILELLTRFFPTGRHTWRDAIISLFAVIPSFALFMASILGYFWLIGLGFSWLNEALLTMMIFIICAIPIIRAIPKMDKFNKIDWVILAVPLYIFFWALVGFFTTKLYLENQALVIVIPLVIIIGLLGYLWPSLDRLLIKNNLNKGG